MILIVGYGNPLRGDDAVGHIAALQLAKLFENDAAVDVWNVQQLTPDLAENIAKYEFVILVDARQQTPAGQIILEKLALPPRMVSRPYSHHMQPVELFALTKALYQASPRIVLATITAEDFEVGKPLSPVVEGALAKLLKQIVALVHDHQQLDQ
jgi:hydrogenase maturation protease